MLELYYYFSANLCDTDKYDIKEMDTNSVFLALEEQEFYDCIRSEKMRDLELLLSNDCNNSFAADVCSIFFSRACCAKQKKTW